MKMSRIGALGLFALCLVPCAHAEQHGAAYATVKAVFDYCGRVDSRHRNDYDAIEAAVLASVARSGDAGDYQAAYTATSDALAKLSQDESRATCAAQAGLVKSGNNDDHQDDRNDGHRDDHRDDHRDEHRDH